MLIYSPRLTMADIDQWEKTEAIDAAHCLTPGYRARIARARESVREFVAGRPDGRFYGGLSFGKDSIVMCHLMREAAPRMPIVSIRNVENFNPDSPRVETVLCDMLSHDYEVITYDYRNADASYYDTQGNPVKWHNILKDLKKRLGAHVTGIRADESAKRNRRVRIFGLETEFSFAPLAYMTVQDIFAYLYENGLPVHPVYAMTGGGRWDKYRLRVAAIGNPEGRGMGRLQWEREYYGDILARMGKTLWIREYDA